MSAGRAVDVDQRACAAAVPQRRVVFDRVEADRDHQIGFIEQAVGRLVVEEADTPGEAVEPFARRRTHSLIGAGDGQPCLVEQGAHRRRRRGLACKHAEQQHGALR